MRWVLGSMLAFVALNAFGGGYYGMAGAKDVPPEWLAGSPFTTYFVPSLFLFFIVGGTCLAAAIAVFARLRIDRAAALASGALLVAWIFAQFRIIGFVSWLQPAIVGSGIVVLLLAATLRRDPTLPSTRRETRNR
jgi:hypothetical protein